MNFDPRTLNFDTAYVIYGIWAAIGLIFYYIFQLRGEIGAGKERSKIDQIEERLKTAEESLSVLKDRFDRLPVSSKINTNAKAEDKH